MRKTLVYRIAEFSSKLRILEKQKISRDFVIKHHVTGEEILYVSFGTIGDHDRDIRPIREWIEENAVMHEWEEDDLLIWDNLKIEFLKDWMF